MEYSKDLNLFLNGDKFSNGAIFKLVSTVSTVSCRDDYLLNIVKDKKILHIGFVDHLPLLDDKISKDTWLHKSLVDISELCYGIDVNKEGVTLFMPLAYMQQSR
mgnify:CR=1 FL=1